jgi:hypothetical protein
MFDVLGDCVAGNRGADCVQHLVPSRKRAGTRHWTGHREPHKQAALARTALGPVSAAIGRARRLHTCKQKMLEWSIPAMADFERHYTTAEDLWGKL